MGEVSSGFGSRTKGDMRVLFLITVRGHGRGGHFHSLNHISQAMGESVEVSICTYGTGRSQVLETNPYFNKHIFYNGKNFIKYKKEVQSIIADFKPDVLHFFDTAAYNTFGLFFNIDKYQVFLNKCGGPNPVEFPLVQNLILFSEENKNWFDSKNKFNKMNIAVIPNRVYPKLLNFNFNKQIEKKDAFCFVRIARIGSAYKKSILDSIRLLEELASKDKNVHLYIIGAIQDNKIAEEIRIKTEGLPITIITNDCYTQKASDMLYLADAVIATGRGIMEATSLGKPILTPAKNSELPVLVNSNNFQQFFATNFSERNVALDVCLKTNYEEINKLIDDDEFFDKLSHFSKVMFKENFSTAAGIPKYLNFYKSNEEDTGFKFHAFSNLKSKLRTWYSFIK